MLQGKTVLIVDDEPKNIFALSAVLKADGINCITAKNGIEGIANIKLHHEIDVVLMDIMMPIMDGYEAIKQIRMDEKMTSIPIIALTANAMKGDMEKCLVAGASDYVSKPVDIEELKNKMINLLTYRQSDSNGRL